VDPQLSTVLPSEVADEVEELAAAATSYDGVAPLNEQTMLRLRSASPGDQHVVVRDAGGRLAGYAYRAADGSAELVVAPASRRQGTGTTLARALVTAGDPGRLSVWAHGRTDGAAAFAARTGFEPVRELFKLRRDARIAPPLPRPVPPEGITVRTFRPGRDEDAWVALNARAFADHPEQGALVRSDLDERMAQPWFDPHGFFLAQERDGALAGFHWTKVHAGPAPVGEVYVVGVDPSYQGTGLGRALTVLGVRHLHDRGLNVVELYVDGTNTPARKLYAALGFTEAAVDVQYRPV
jgi:mycothiol synthase